MKKVTKTREELYEMIWKEPLTSIVKRYHITYTEFRQVYHDLNIPIPEGGYWSKLLWGKEVEKVKLPESYTGKQEIELKEKDPNDPIPQLTASPKSSVEQDTEEIFKVPQRLTNPDILITNTKEYFDAVNKHDWRSRDRYPERKDVMSVDVQHCNLPRALRIFDTIIKILRSRGYDISFGWKGSEAVIYGQKIGMRLREINKVSDKPKEGYCSRELDPTGRLTFLIGNYEVKTVSDGRKLIEEKINTIIDKLEAEAKQWYDWHIEAEIREKERQEQQLIKREARELKNKELSNFKSLFYHASRLHQATIMKSYISIVEKQNHESSEEFTRWVQWAKQKVNWYDPLINGPDESFTEEDKTNIFRDLIKEWQ
jgi:hypothetical protein